MDMQPDQEEADSLEPTELRARPIEPDPDNISSLSPSVGGADDEKVVSLLMLDPEAARLAREARRPNIDWLEDAVVTVDGEQVPLFEVGDRIVIERRAGEILRGAPWLDTQTYQVMSINDETGELHLWNRELCQHGWGNYITGPERGDVYKLAPNTKATFSKRKRGRPRKHPEKAAEVTPASGEKKKRGRPKGSKNRPKEERVTHNSASRCTS